MYMLVCGGGEGGEGGRTLGVSYLHIHVSIRVPFFLCAVYM